MKLSIQSEVKLVEDSEFQLEKSFKEKIAIVGQFDINAPSIALDFNPTDYYNTFAWGSPSMIQIQADSTVNDLIRKLKITSDFNLKGIDGVEENVTINFNSLDDFKLSNIITTCNLLQNKRNGTDDVYFLENNQSILKELKNVERYYYSLKTFLDNIKDVNNIEVIDIFNVNYEDITSQDSSIRAFVQQRQHDNANLLGNYYSILVLPLLLRNNLNNRNKIIFEMWSSLCKKFDILLITEFSNIDVNSDYLQSTEFNVYNNIFDKFQMMGNLLKPEFNIQLNEEHEKNCVVCVNDIFVREPEFSYGEAEPLYIGGACAFAAIVASKDFIYTGTNLSLPIKHYSDLIFHFTPIQRQKLNSLGYNVLQIINDRIVIETSKNSYQGENKILKNFILVVTVKKISLIIKSLFSGFEYSNELTVLTRENKTLLSKILDRLIYEYKLITKWEIKKFVNDSYDDRKISLEVAMTIKSFNIDVLIKFDFDISSNE